MKFVRTVDDTDVDLTHNKPLCVCVCLTRTMESEEGRKAYIVFPTSKTHPSSQKGRKRALKGNGRRIDYMLYTEEGLYLEWKVVSPVTYEQAY